MKNTRSLLSALLLLAAGATALVGCKSSQSTETASAKSYPLQTCLVSDEKLDGHGKPFVFVHQGQEIKLCCEDCRKDFDKTPAKFMQKLTAAK